MNNLLLGNIIGLLGSLFMIAIGFIKKKRNILIAQTVQFVLMAASNLLLGAVTGTISNGVSIVRNIVCCSTAFTLPLKILFLSVQGILSIVFNQSGWIGWLPFVAVLIYTWFLDTKSEITLKRSIIVCQILWTVFDLYFKNYTTCAFDVFTMVSNFIGILMIRRDDRLAK